jgi:hypothetical protein
MRLPSITLPPLPAPLQALRDEINGLPDEDRKALMGRLWGDTIRRNDQRHQLAYERAERERNRRRPDPRQLRLENVA